MDPIQLLRFQNNQLEYNFKDVDLLQEALTHSLDFVDESLTFPAHNRRHVRLKVLGARVLKLITTRALLELSDATETAESLEYKRDELIRCVDNVAEDVFHLGTHCIRKQSRVLVVSYGDFILALFGAVFVDSGGTSGKGLSTCRKMYLHMWQDYLDSPSNIGGDNPSLHSRFEVEEEEYDTLPELQSELEKLLGFQFVRKHLLAQALKPDSYDRLAFLGESVLELVVAEHALHKFSPDSTNFSCWTEEIQKYTGDSYLEQLFDRLELGKFISDDNLEQGGKWIGDKGDIWESTVGAMYADRGVRKVREFIVKQWQLTGKPYPQESSSIHSLQMKLGYKFREEHLLILSLSGEQAIGIFKMAGGLLIEMLIEEYWTKCNIEIDGGVERANLCSPSVLKSVAELLKLQQLPQFNHAFSSREILIAVFGAVWMDIQTHNKTDLIQLVFYRVWNHYLTHVPKYSLVDCFSEGEKKLSLEIRSVDKVISEIEKVVGYQYKNKHLIVQILNGPDGKREKCILRFHKLFKGVRRFLLHILVFHSKIEDVKFDLGTYVHNQIGSDLGGLFNWNKVVASHFTLPSEYKDDLKRRDAYITNCVLGAIYVDMTEVGIGNIWGFREFFKELLFNKYKEAKLTSILRKLEDNKKDKDVKKVDKKANLCAAGAVLDNLWKAVFKTFKIFCVVAAIIIVAIFVKEWIVGK